MALSYGEIAEVLATIGGFAGAILAMAIAGARWTSRIEAGTKMIELQSQALREENRAEHEEIKQWVRGLTSPQSETHERIFHSVEDHERRLRELERRVERLERA